LTPTEIEVADIGVDDPVARLITAAQEAVRAALREHKLAGNPVAAWRDGKVVLLPPEQIET
jgi:hypothetical protein